MNFDSRAKAIIAVFAAQIIWGVAGLLVKIVLADVPPFSLLFFRSLLTCLILYPILEYRVIKGERLQTISSQDKWTIFWAGFTGVFLNIALYFIGQKLTTVIDAWVINSTGALFVILISYIFIRERLNRIVYFGVALAFVGTLVIIGTPVLGIGSGSIPGNLLILGSTLVLGISYVLTKRLMDRFSPLLLAYYFFLIGLFFSLPFFLWEYLQNPGWIAALSTGSWLIIAYLTIGSSIIAYALDNFALIRLSASAVATAGYISVVIALGLGIIFLHEQMTPFFIAGTIITFCGLFLAETRHPNHPLHKLRRK
ncbi:MAG: DMT family transporter [Patescibacteria group bacterium]|nr:DMT family transporter [Patescibacteria group bacterium]MCL5432149.1 DMT family transporter [Patescibacteria group bacterium]